MARNRSRFATLSAAPIILAAQLALFACSSTSSGPAVASISVNQQSLTLALTQTTTLVATTKDAGGNVLTGRAITWASSAAAVATVDQTGLVTAVSAGSAQISATSEGQTALVAVTVLPVPVATVTLNVQASTLVPAQTVLLSATTKDASGTVVSGRVVTWSTSAAAVATVDANGLVTGVSPGTATITATSEGKTAAAAITVVTGAFVGATGGTVTGFGGNASVTIPAGALTVGTAITISPVANPQSDPTLVAGTAYDFGPTGTVFATPVTLSIAYPAAATGNQSQFRIFKLIGSTWTLVAGGSVNTATHVASAPTSSFSTYAILEVPLPIFTVTVTGGGTGSGTITAPAVGTQPAFNCTITNGIATTGCTQNYTSGTALQLTATGTASATFTSWGGACSGAVNTCAVTVSGPLTIGATFTLANFALTIQGSGVGSGTVTVPATAGKPALNCTIVAGVASSFGCTQTYPTGTFVQLTEIGLSGAVFTGWTGSTCGLFSNPCTLLISGPTTVTAGFALPNFTVAIVGGGAGGGTVTAPAAGGQPALNCTITAGLAGVGCSQSYPLGTALQLTATSVAGGTFTSWTGGGCDPTTNPCSITVTTSASITATFAGPPGFTVISTGKSTSCGLTPSGAAWCWGYQYAADNVTAVTSAFPTQIPGGLLFTQISVGTAQTNINGLFGAPAPVCALTSAGAAWCWGSGGSGELTNGLFASQAPVPVSGFHVFTRVSVGTGHACGITLTGDVWCWGTSTFGELGNGSNNPVNSVPVLVANGHVFSAVSAGENVTCALEAGTAWCWGKTGEGEMGNGLAVGNGPGGTSQNVPVAVTGGQSFVGIAAGSKFACGLTPIGTIWCWGLNTNGVLGNGTNIVSSLVPVQVSGANAYVALTAGGTTACALTAVGGAWCWGTGPLGTGSVSTSSTPVAVTGSLTFSSLSAFGFGTLGSTCGVTFAKVAVCWGANPGGTVGDGSFTTPRLFPTSVVVPAGASLRAKSH